MQLASSPRRALGLVAVGAIGMSTAVLGATGVASAETSSSVAPFTIAATSASGSVSVPAGYCAVDWIVLGAQGGAEFEGATGGLGDELRVRTEVLAGLELNWVPGGVGGNAADQETAGTAGSGGAGYGGEAGQPGTGGGGGASAVTWDDESILAKGGDGAGDGGGQGGGDATGASWSMGPTVVEEGTHSGAGSVAGTGVKCSAPPAPSLDSAMGGDGSVTVRFFAPMTSWQGVAERDEDGIRYQSIDDTYQYTINGGATWQTLAVTPGTGEALNGTISGLTGGTTYKIQVRAGSLVGYGAASEIVSATPYTAYDALDAPASATIVAGINSVTFTWTAPADDAAAVGGYTAVAFPQEFEGDPEAPGAPMVAVCEVPAGTTSCTTVATPGFSYGGYVATVDKADRPGGDTATGTSAKVTASKVSASLPKADGTLTSDAADGKVVSGGKVTISGKDFLPGSTVELIVYSTPVKLGEVTVLSDGTFSAEVTLPEDLADGVHHLVATGVDVNGNVRNLVVEVTVSGGTAALALTGFSALPYAGAGALALLVGSGLLLSARRRQAA